MLNNVDSALPPKSERPVSLRKPLRQLSLGQDTMPASPLISTRNLVPGLSDSVVKLDRLGKGATSNVFRAVHAATLKMIALKEVTVSNDADRRAVRTEMRALHTQRSPLLTSTFTTELASCPRIVDYYGSVVQENGNACIAVEYVAGGSLGSWLDSGCLCPEAWIAHIAHQALEALDFVHSGGRVHRDVKPANLLITKNGDLKLGDFGAAGVENSSRMVGTQRFMAPERLKGRRATAQSDLWSLGLSLATAALGDDFISQASNQFEQLDLAERARRTLLKATTLSADLTDFLHQCLSRDPARRPALRELMKHPFLEQRHRWQSKCPEVALAMRDRNRRQREEASVALSPDDVIDALCRVRAEVNPVGTRVDPAMAADLAYELGVSAQSLVRNVYLRTLEIIRERGSVSTSGSVCGSTSGSISGSGSGSVNGGDCGGGGGRSGGENCDGTSCRGGRDCGRGGDGGGDTSGVSDSGGGSGAEERACRGGDGGGGASTGRRRRRSTTNGRGCAEDPGCAHSDGSLSPLRSLDADPSGCGRRGSRRLEARGSARAAAPMATVGGRDCHYPPLSTPRNRSIGGFSSAPNMNGRATPYGGGCGGGGRGGGDPSSCSRRGRRRALEVPSSVKLTPHKRRGERKSSQMKRNGSSSCCEQDGARRSRDRRERARVLAARDGKRDAMVSVAGAGGGVEAPAPSGRRHRSKKEASGGGGGGRGRARGECCCRSQGGEEGESVDARCRRRHRTSGQSQQHHQTHHPHQRKSRDEPRTSASRALPSRADVSQRSMRGVFQIADEMKAEIRVRDRVHRLRVYPNCFSGREAVQWMLDGCHASSVMEAEKLGNEMMKASVFQHIRNSHVFEDSSVFYQFTDGETPPPPARGGRRLRQIARVFGGHVARKLVYNGIVGGGGSGSGDAGASGGTANVAGTANSGGSSGGGGGSDTRRRTLSGARKTGAVGGSHCTADRCVCGSKQQRSPLESGGTTTTSAADSVAGSTKGSTSSFSTFRQPLGGGAGKGSKGKPPRLPASGSTDRNSKHRRRRNASGASESQLRRFSSSMSTATVPETPLPETPY